jgi:hypothetical protein
VFAVSVVNFAMPWWLRIVSSIVHKSQIAPHIQHCCAQKPGYNMLKYITREHSSQLPYNKGETREP